MNTNTIVKDQVPHLFQMYDGSVKLAIPARTLQGSGSFSSSGQTAALDTTFSWDAERDISKQVGFSAKLTRGDKTKADLTFRLPSIGKVGLDQCVCVCVCLCVV